MIYQLREGGIISWACMTTCRVGLWSYIPTLAIPVGHPKTPKAGRKNGLITTVFVCSVTLPLRELNYFATSTLTLTSFVPFPAYPTLVPFFVIIFQPTGPTAPTWVLPRGTRRSRGVRLLSFWNATRRSYMRTTMFFKLPSHK